MSVRAGLDGPLQPITAVDPAPRRAERYADPNAWNVDIGGEHRDPSNGRRSDPPPASATPVEHGSWISTDDEIRPVNRGARERPRTASTCLYAGVCPRLDERGADSVTRGTKGPTVWTPAEGTHG